MAGTRGGGGVVIGKAHTNKGSTGSDLFILFMCQIE